MGYIKPDIWELIGSYPICPFCQGRHVVRDAWAEWNGATREWMLKAVFDEFVCDQCGHSIIPVWKIDQEFRRKRIRRLNDEMRRGRVENGTVVLSTGVKAFSDEWLQVIGDNVMRYDDFNKENDPHGEHDFGSFEVAGEKLFWKIDYFDHDLKGHSPDAANPEMTHRVLTIMLASEY